MCFESESLHIMSKMDCLALNSKRVWLPSSLYVMLNKRLHNISHHYAIVMSEGPS
jgi:hypothetical protein